MGCVKKPEIPAFVGFSAKVRTKPQCVPSWPQHQCTAIAREHLGACPREQHIPEPGTTDHGECEFDQNGMTSVILETRSCADRAPNALHGSKIVPIAADNTAKIIERIFGRDVDAWDGEGPINPSDGAMCAGESVFVARFRHKAAHTPRVTSPCIGKQIASAMEF